MNVIKTDSGQALIQAVMGMALVGLISYTALTYQSSNVLEQKRQAAQIDIDAAAQLISSLTAVPSLCNSNVFLQTVFVRPANVATDEAPLQQLRIALGTLQVSARPVWVPANNVPGFIDDFNTSIDQISLQKAKLKTVNNLGNEIWRGEVVISAQRQNNTGSDISGRRVVAEMELEVDALGNKVSCQTATSVASVCRDLGGVYDPLGVPNCIFALEDMDCSGSGPDGYIHDIVGGTKVCGSARSDCPTGYFAIGINDGLLDCRPLARNIATATTVTCEVGAIVGGAGGPTPTATCNCTSASQNWNGTACANPPILCEANATSGGAGGATPTPPCRCTLATESWNGSMCAPTALCATAPPNNAYMSLCPTGTTRTMCGTGAYGCSGVVNPTDPTNVSPAVFRGGTCPTGYENGTDVSTGSCALTQCDRVCLPPTTPAATGIFKLLTSSRCDAFTPMWVKNSNSPVVSAPGNFVTPADGTTCTEGSFYIKDLTQGDPGCAGQDNITWQTCDPTNGTGPMTGTTWAPYNYCGFLFGAAAAVPGCGSVTTPCRIGDVCTLSSAGDSACDGNLRITGKICQ